MARAGARRPRRFRSRRTLAQLSALSPGTRPPPRSAPWSRHGVHRAGPGCTGDRAPDGPGSARRPPTRTRSPRRSGLVAGTTGTPPPTTRSAAQCWMQTGPRPSPPSNAPSASLKSPVDRPRRYKTGRTSSTFGERRMYGGRIELVKRWAGLRSSTRGALTSTVPAPIVTCRARARPLRTTSARPSSPRSPRCLSKYSETSTSRASTSIRRAPSRKSSSRGTAVFPSEAVSTILSMGGVSFLPASDRAFC